MGAWETVGAHVWVAGIASHGSAIVLYCLGPGLSQWRPLDIPGTHLPYNTMQLLMECYSVARKKQLRPEKTKQQTM